MLTTLPIYYLQYSDILILEIIYISDIFFNTKTLQRQFAMFLMILDPNVSPFICLWKKSLLQS